MSSELHHYTREEFLGEFFPAPKDKAEIAAGMKQLRAEQRAWRLAEMRRRRPVYRGFSRIAATVRSIHAVPARCGFRPGPAADGHGIPASFSAG